ncbi:MAG: hypothetical protein MUC36_14175 [Planctomycetes bacterium]|jgi:hypothetical protein|nr:hypothetical protein [Planctomycetota bacterium]
MKPPSSRVRHSITLRTIGFAGLVFATLAPSLAAQCRVVAFDDHDIITIPRGSGTTIPRSGPLTVAAWIRPSAETAPYLANASIRTIAGIGEVRGQFIGQPWRASGGWAMSLFRPAGAPLQPTQL